MNFSSTRNQKGREVSFWCKTMYLGGFIAIYLNNRDNSKYKSYYRGLIYKHFIFPLVLTATPKTPHSLVLINSVKQSVIIKKLQIQLQNHNKLQLQLQLQNQKNLQLKVFYKLVLEEEEENKKKKVFLLWEISYHH